MNLTSCDNCGVVLDKDKLPFPDDLWNDDGGSIDTDKAVWDGDTFVAFTQCPICQSEIRKNQ